MSLGKRCDAGMKITLTSDRIIVPDQKMNKQVLEGTRSRNDSVWCLDIVDESSVHKDHEENSVYELNKKTDIIKFLSAVMWYPVPCTWIKAIDAGFFATWTGLTSQLVQKHIEKKEHRNRQRTFSIN